MPPGGRESRDDYKKRKEIEEARKAGTVAPEMDNDGNMINPHIPEYMSKAPWYLNQEEGAGLKHQRYALENKKYYDSLRVKKKKGLGYRAKKFRKGACTNCGAITHKTNECVEAPRRRGAKLTGRDIMPDEIKSAGLSLTWDGKRDRWAGYDPAEHKKTIEMYRLAEENRALMKKKLRDKKGRDTQKKKKLKGLDVESDTDTDSDSDSDSDSDTDSDDNSDDEMRFEQAEEGQFESKHATRMKCSVRNLRIREDLPKYLRNLDPNSAHYDPKTRSMRANPTPNMDPDQLIYAGDNFVRLSGDSNRLAATQVFAWEAYSRGLDVNMQADPTTTAHMQKITKKRKEDLEDKKKSTIRNKYGNQETYKAPDRSLLLGETTTMLRYTKDGRRVEDGQVDVIPSTKYVEDVRIHNHTCVWGSWYSVDSRQWGYACCHLTVKQGYCTGRAGIEAAKKSAAMLAIKSGNMAAAAATKAPKADDGAPSKVAELNASLEKRKLYGYDETSEVEIDPKKLKLALKRQKAAAKAHDETDDRKRKYHSLKVDDDVTAEDMEAYRMTKMRKDDPMAQFMADNAAAVDSGDEAEESDDDGDAAAAAAAERRRQKQERKKKKKKKKRRK